MKKTQYFLSPSYSYDRVQAAIDSVIDLKNKFIEKEGAKITEIVMEDIKLHNVNQNTRTYALLTISYFSK